MGGQGRGRGGKRYRRPCPSSIRHRARCAAQHFTIVYDIKYFIFMYFMITTDSTTKDNVQSLYCTPETNTESREPAERPYTDRQSLLL